MQFAFAAREPILDVTQNVYAYALVFRDGKQGAIPEHQDDRQTAIERQFDTLSLKDISGDKRSLIEFTDNALINALPEFEDHTKIIAHLSHTQAKQPDVLEACEGLKRKGMLFALKLDKLETMSLLLLNMVDIVSISYAHFTNNTVDHDLLELLDTLQNNNIRLLVTDVETIDAYTHLQSYKVHYFQGYFFTQIKHSDKDSLPSSKITILELVQASNTDQFDVDKISNILERDPSLSYALLRFINNPTINKRNEITSLKHALTYLGEVEVKQFIALISIMSLNADNPTELLHVSLVRAKFLELL